ncbi:hypothetical protein [Halopelagius longus]|uniref:hypothetical protein n=1 Tax=Halopelagius longus TaxID=1236180 RepID=UPI0011135547|nr:hypothetical protein [Halopelagius longus]
MELTIVLTLVLVGPAPFTIVWVWIRRPERSRIRKLRFTFSMLAYASGLCLFGLFRRWTVSSRVSTAVFWLMGLSLASSLLCSLRLRRTSSV